jgi:hypothetical protein
MMPSMAALLAASLWLRSNDLMHLYFVFKSLDIVTNAEGECGSSICGSLLLRMTHLQHVLALGLFTFPYWYNLTLFASGVDTTASLGFAW